MGPRKRKFEGTHPWLSFRADLKRAPIEVWLLLGEARSKVDHIAGVPLRPATAEDLHRIYLAKGVLATTAIEGNTLSEREVMQHLEGKLHLPPSKQYLEKEISNIVSATNAVWDATHNGAPARITPSDILQFNKMVLDGLDVEEGVTPGEFRTYSVGVGRYRGAPAEDLEYLVERLCGWLNDEVVPTPELGDLATAIVKAVLAHLYLAWIHPFGDGNGRTARLVEFKILVGAGVPTPAAHLLSNHYNETRTEYYRQLDRSSQADGDIAGFLRYAVRGFVDQMKEQLGVIRLQQLDVAWRNYVHELFRGQETASVVRQRELILDLSMLHEPVPRSALRVLSPRIARNYAQKTDKTITRDINALLGMGLLKREQGGYAAAKERILAFLPSSTKQDELLQELEGEIALAPTTVRGFRSP